MEDCEASRSQSVSLSAFEGAVDHPVPSAIQAPPIMLGPGRPDENRSEKALIFPGELFQVED